MEIFIKRALVFVPLYFALAFLPVLFGAGSDLHATYFSKGVSLAFVILFGPIMGFLVFSGQFLVASIIGIPFTDSLILALVSASFTVIAGLALKRLRNSTISHDHKALIALFCLIIFVFHPVAVACARLLGYSPGEDLLYLLDGWLAYGNGQVVVTPLVLVSYSWYRSGKDWPGVREALIWAATAGLLTLFLVWAAGYAPVGYRQLTIGLLIPFFIILSLRKDPLPVCSALFSCTLVVCLAADLVPWTGHRLFQDHVVLHMFMIGLNISALLIVSFSQNEGNSRKSFVKATSSTGCCSNTWIMPFFTPASFRRCRAVPLGSRSCSGMTSTGKWSA